MKIFVTGLGAVSSIGLTVQENFRSLAEEKTGIKKSSFSFLKKEFQLGKVSITDEEIIEKSGLQNGPYSRTSLLGYLAAREAIGNNPLNPAGTGFISATTVGGMDRSEQYYHAIAKQGSAPIDLLRTHDSGDTTSKIAAELGIGGYINTLSTACSSSANAIMLGARMIRNKLLHRVIAGGSDALTAFTICGFNSLFIFDPEWCKPFDENRNGLNLGEGAAYLMLESEASIRETGNTPLCELSGWGNAADAYHQTASSPEGKGATLSMQAALRHAGMDPGDISYINAHGTGTKNNDLSESAALQNVFGENIPAFSSTKSFTGHTLAAAGAIEAVFSICALKNNVVYPNLNFTTPISEYGLQPSTHFVKKNVSAVLSNSFGFGGNNTTLIFRKG